jgi:hypothetical protein
MEVFIVRSIENDKLLALVGHNAWWVWKQGGHGFSRLHLRAYQRGKKAMAAATEMLMV